jgi:hypothetical protein
MPMCNNDASFVLTLTRYFFSMRVRTASNLTHHQLTNVYKYKEQ